MNKTSPRRTPNVEAESYANTADLLLLLSFALYAGGAIDVANTGVWIRTIVVWIAATVIFCVSTYFRNLARR